MKLSCPSLCLGHLFALALAIGLPAAELPPTTLDLPLIGKIAPRSAKDITASDWSIGGETLDRDFAIYANYKKYLGPLGAKAIRFQAGWAKCETKPGVYDWAWLDAVVDDAIAQGVHPWLELSYGNKLYPGGGDTGLGGGFPSSTEGKAAWDRWTRATVQHFKGRVEAWEIWNEPDLNRDGAAKASAYTDLFIRTASMIRQEQPTAKIYALALANQPAYADEFIRFMSEQGRLDLIDAITFHGYPKNPDDTQLTDALRAIIAKTGKTIPVRQGETGAPSKFQENFALSKLPWSENTQTKWDLRRLLAHHAKNVPMNLFTMIDLHYTTASHQGGADGVLRMNYKGLLATNPDQTVAYVKPMYVAAQAVFSIFDATLQPIPDYPAKSTATRPLALTGYEKKSGGKAQVVALWFNDAAPVEELTTTPIDVTLGQAHFTEPVLVDLRTAQVYSIPASRWQQSGNTATFRQMPVYDSPVLLAEKSARPLGSSR
jgi:hypothetical protein